MLKVKKVYKNGIGSELGIEKGDAIIEFNGSAVSDVLDYLYYDAQPYFTLTVLSKQGERVTVEIEKEDDESLGLEFESDNLDIKTCKNKCVFCFVDQMPKGLRPSLYVKDDDYRQSFLRGNFVTLTNVSGSDIERIIRLNLSPLYISVQVTDGEVRKKLLNNRFAGNILEILKKLTSNGIKVEAQVVLVKGFNDGVYLEKTCRDLFALGENLSSVAVVPCGITKFREGLYPIENITEGYANCVIEQVNALNLEFGKNFVILADEFYFRALKTPINPELYGNFSQVGNGVGLTAKFKQELDECAVKSKSEGKKYIISGTSASEFVNETLKELSSKIEGLNAEVIAVKNEFFGETVNCTGLLVGSDIINATKGRLSSGDALVLPCVCLKEDEDVFLDGVTLQDLKSELGVKIIVTDGSGESFFSALTNGDRVRII